MSDKEDVFGIEKSINFLKTLCKEKGLEEELGKFLFNFSFLPGGGYYAELPYIEKFFKRNNEIKHLFFEFNNGEEIEEFIKNKLESLVKDWNEVMFLVVRPKGEIYLKDKVFGNAMKMAEKFYEPFYKIIKKLGKKGVIDHQQRLCYSSYKKTRFEKITDERKFYLHLFLGR